MTASRQAAIVTRVLFSGLVMSHHTHAQSSHLDTLSNITPLSRNLQSNSVLWKAWGGPPPNACLTADPDAMVRWDPQAQRCEPDICDGAVLTDMRDLDGRARVKNICAGPLYDTNRTTACLSGKNLLFMGESTMQVSVGVD